MGCNGPTTIAVFRNLFLAIGAPFLAFQNSCAIALIGNTVAFSGTIVSMQGVGANVNFTLQASFDTGESWESIGNLNLAIAPLYNRVVQTGFAAPLLRMYVELLGPAGSTAIIHASVAMTDQ